MKKIIKYGVGTVLTLIICSVTYLYFAPVDFDAGACVGGYERWVADKYT